MYSSCTVHVQFIYSDWYSSIRLLCCCWSSLGRCYLYHTCMILRLLCMIVITGSYWVFCEESTNLFSDYLNNHATLSFHDCFNVAYNSTVTSHCKISVILIILYRFYSLAVPLWNTISNYIRILSNDQCFLWFKEKDH